jgi:hypothetical protein
VTGNHHNHRRVFAFANTGQCFEPVDARQPHVEQHDVGLLAAEKIEAILTTFNSGDLVAFVLQNVRQ